MDFGQRGVILTLGEVWSLIRKPYIHCSTGKEQEMSEWNDLAHWLYGDVKMDRGFWYSHPLCEINGLTEDQLFWVPDERNLCMLWHVGHIAHRERTHIGKFVQGIKTDLIPPEYEVFGPDWCSVDEIHASVQSVKEVFKWVQDVRAETTKVVQSLSDSKWHQIGGPSELDLTIAHWVFLTVAHEAIHIGKLQMLRAMLEGKKDRAC